MQSRSICTVDRFGQSRIIRAARHEAWVKRRQHTIFRAARHEAWVEKKRRQPRNVRAVGDVLSEAEAYEA